MKDRQEEESSRRTDLGSSEREMRQMTGKGPGIVAMGDTTFTAIPSSKLVEGNRRRVKAIQIQEIQGLGDR